MLHTCINHLQNTSFGREVLEKKYLQLEMTAHDNKLLYSCIHSTNVMFYWEKKIWVIFLFRISLLEGAEIYPSKYMYSPTSVIRLRLDLTCLDKRFGWIWDLCLNTASSVGLMHVTMYFLIATVFVTNYCWYRVDIETD